MATGGHGAHRGQRVRQQLPGLPAAGTPHRRAHRGRPRDRPGRAGPDGAGARDRRRAAPPRAPRPHTQPHQLGPDLRRGGGGRGGPRPRRPLPPGRLPVGGPGAGGRPGHRLRLPFLHQPKVPARAQGGGLPLRSQVGVGPAGAGLHRSAWRGVGGERGLRPAPHCQALRVLRDQLCKQAHKPSRSTGCQALEAPCIPARCTASQCRLSATPCLLTILPISTPAVKVGLGVAAQEAVDVGMDTISTAIAKVATALRKGLQGVPGITVQDQGRRLGGIVSFTAADTPAEVIQARLLEQGINVWTSRAPSTRIDMEDRGLDSVVRASVHSYNTLDEVETFLRVLRAVL
uniref:Aminotransferase class V domain-containing protein n=1 Tax=Auxenochlorella protothecoides TaxID=3075 RepID=A0A1D2AA49_AUXPR